MSKKHKHPTYRIKPDPQKKSFKIFTNKDTHDKIIRFLLKKNCFVKDHRSFTTHFLEIDHRGLKALIEDNKKEINASPKKVISVPDIEIEKESQLEKILEEKNYDLDLRIWKKEKDGGEDFCCEVEGNIYSCPNLDSLISFLRGDALIESNKPITNLSINPLTVFGIFGVAADALSSDKSIVRYNFYQGKRQKQFNPIIENAHHFRIVIDGADDTANALNNTGLPQQTIALVQGLLIFPLFLKGVHLGYEGLGEEAKETKDEFQESYLKRAEIEAKLEQFKKDLCKICKIEYDLVKNHSPQKFLKIVADKIAQIDDLEIKNQITKIALQYQQEVEVEFEAPEIKDVLAAHCGWLAMTAMMTSVGVYEAQAVINIFGGIDKLTIEANGAESLFSTIGNSFGFAGQCLMTIYAFHKMIDERKEWKEAEEELQKFRGAKDVSDLAKQITDELLAAKRNNHKLQTFGNATLSAGQAMMAVGGPIGLGLNPLLFAGLAATLGGVAVNSVAEFKYQSSYQISEDIDELEKKIITKPPQFSEEDFKNIGEALSRHAKERILQLEILGHLRAPQFVLYQKFLKENKDESGILGNAVNSFGWSKISGWLNKPPTASTDLVKDNPLIKTHPKNKNDLDIFTVEEANLDNALTKYQIFTSNGISHYKAIERLQAEFITTKSNVAEERNPKTAKELCASLIKKNGAAGSYLTKELMRAVTNGYLEYNGSLKDNVSEVRKNGKKIIIAQLDLDKFNEEELTQFLSKKRTQKHTIFSRTRKSPLEEARDNEIFVVKSDHLRPFVEVAKVNSVTTDFLDSDIKKHSQQKQHIAPHSLKPEHTTENQSSSDFNHVHTAPISSNLASTRERRNEKKPEYKTKSLPSSKDSEKTLLTKFKDVVAEKISQNPSERDQQIKKQNKIIDKVLENSREFVLKSEVKNHEKNQTIFTYLDPYHTDPNDRDYEAKQVIYVRNDLNGKIDVLYGKKACALFIERPNQVKNGVITKIDEIGVEHYGEISGSIFQSFKKIDLPKKLPATTIEHGVESRNFQRNVGPIIGLEL